MKWLNGGPKRYARVKSLGTCECQLIGKGVFEEVIRVRI